MAGATQPQTASEALAGTSSAELQPPFWSGKGLTIRAAAA